MIKRFRNTIQGMLKLLMLVICFLSFYVPYGLKYKYLFNLSRTSIIMVVTFAVCYLLMTRIYGGFDIGKKKSRPIAFSIILSVFFVDLITHFFLCVMNVTITHQGKFVYEYPLMLLGIFVLQDILIIACTYGANALYFSIFKPQRILAVALEGSDVENLMKYVGQYRRQYSLTGTVFSSENKDEVFKAIDKVDAVFFYGMTVSQRASYVSYCYSHRKDVYYSIELADVADLGSERVLFGDKSMIYSSVKEKTIEQRIIKRVMDIVISILGLIIMSPTLLVSAIAIKIEDGGSVFYRQERVTIGGRLFKVIKFRSMKEGEDEMKRSAVKDDPRITKVGRVLRKYRIDELPQLVNVLKGEMSLVGPRPEMVENVRKYTEELPEFALRTRFKAGLTGMAQVYGKYNTSPKDKLILDLSYIQEYSIWLDIKIIMRTLMVLFSPGESTEGFDDEY